MFYLNLNSNRVIKKNQITNQNINPSYIISSLVAIFLFGILLIPSCKNQQTSSLILLDANKLNTISDSTSKTSKKNREYSPIDAIRCAIIDRAGTLWFGTNNDGVFSFDGKYFTHFTTSNGLTDNHVASIIQDDEGDLWFGTGNGLCRYDGKTFNNVSIPWTDTSSIWLDKVYPVVNPNEVRSMIQDKDGIFWLGTNGAGVYRYDPDAVKNGGIEFTSFLSNQGRKQSDSLYHNIISSITEDEDGNIWFTSMTHGGVSRYDGIKMTHFEVADGLSDDMVLTSFMDSSGDLWFGSLGNRNGGLDRFNTSIEGQNNNTKVFTNFNEAGGLCNNNNVSIYEDKRGYFWLGSQRGEMCIYDGETFVPFTSKEGETFQGIIFITGDKEGNIYFGGRDGQLYKYDLNAEEISKNSLTDLTHQW